MRNSQGDRGCQGRHIAEYEVDTLNSIGDGIGGTGHRDAIYCVAGILGGYGLCQIFCAGGIISQQIIYAVTCTIGSYFQAVVCTTGGRRENETIGCATSIVNDRSAYAYIGSIDGIADALQGIVGAVYSDVFGSAAIGSESGAAGGTEIESDRRRRAGVDGRAGTGLADSSQTLRLGKSGYSKGISAG